MTPMEYIEKNGMLGDYRRCMSIEEIVDKNIKVEVIKRHLDNSEMIPAQVVFMVGWIEGMKDSLKKDLEGKFADSVKGVGI